MFSLNPIGRRKALVGLSLFGLAACSKTEAPHIKVAAYYTCTMHPFVRSQDPHGKCPVCGMDLVAVYDQPEQSNASVEPARKTVNIPPERLQAIGVSSEVVARRDLRATLRAPATVEIDESNLVDINVKQAGYITKLYAAYEGMSFSKDQPLMTVRCPAWIESQLDYIKAFRAWKKGIGGDAIANELEMKRAKIQLWGLVDAQIHDLEQMALGVKDLATLADSFDITAPFEGYIHKKKAMEGMRFEAGQSLLEFAAHGQVWISARFPENQRMNLSVGQVMTVTFPAMTEHVLSGSISFIDTHVEDHQIMARIVVSDAVHMFHPGMLAEVNAEIPLGNQLAIPCSAVLPTGMRNIVFLDRGEGNLEPKEVQVGSQAGDFYPVTSGLIEGDKVVTSANFLIDAESRVQGVLKTWGANP